MKSTNYNKNNRFCDFFNQAAERSQVAHAPTIDHYFYRTNLVSYCIAKNHLRADLKTDPHSAANCQIDRHSTDRFPQSSAFLCFYQPARLSAALI